MRAFFAVELPPEVRAALAQAQRALAASGADVKWAAEGQLHVTIKFLGEIAEPQRAAVERAAAAVAQTIAPIEGRCSSIGAFPSVNALRVIWAGIEPGATELASLAQRLEDALAAESFPKEERKFVAHVTLGRVRSPKHRAALVAQMQQLAWTPPPPFTTSHLALFQSTLTSSGSIYTLLSNFPFSAA